MSHSSPSRYRREGRNAFYPGGDPEVSCPYSIGSFSYDSIWDSAGNIVQWHHS